MDILAFLPSDSLSSFPTNLNTTRIKMNLKSVHLDQSVLLNAPTILVKVLVNEYLATKVELIARVFSSLNHTYNYDRN